MANDKVALNKVPPPVVPLSVRLSLIEDGAVKPQGRADLRRSGRMPRPKLAKIR